MTKHIIRPMRYEDIASIVEIEQTAYYDPWPASAFHDCIWVEYPCYVLLRDGKIVAYIIWHYILDEGHLLNICVAPRYQQRGIATELLQFFINKMQEESIKKIFLEVRASNVSALHLYEKFGFKSVGIRKNYYNTSEGPENGIIYLLDLPSNAKD